MSIVKGDFVVVREVRGRGVHPRLVGMIGEVVETKRRQNSMNRAPIMVRFFEGEILFFENQLNVVDQLEER